MMMKKTPLRLIILALIAACGLILSAVLSHQYYEIRSGAGGFKSLCNISQKMNCDAVAASPYAELIGGLPLSSFSSGWFLASGILALMALSQTWRREASRGLLALFAIGSAISLIYLYVMAFVIQTYCLFCLMVDGLNFAGLALVLTSGFWKKTETASSAEPNDGSKWKTLGTVVVGSLFVAIVLSKNMDGYTLDSATASQIVDSVLATPPVAVGSGEEFPSIGPKNAPITIVEFSDFQCPFCRIGATVMNSILNRYPNQVRVVFRNFPLDPSCNSQVQRSMHPYACEMARLSLCAHRQGKFKEVYENFFENQALLGHSSSSSPLSLAQAAGADPTQLSSCHPSTEINSAITRDIEEGKRLGIASTPTFFLNGIKIEGVSPPPVWNQIIDRILASHAHR